MIEKQQDLNENELENEPKKISHVSKKSPSDFTIPRRSSLSKKRNIISDFILAPIREVLILS